MANSNKISVIALLLVVVGIAALGFLFSKMNSSPKTGQVADTEIARMKEQLARLEQENTDMRNKVAKNEKAVLGPVKLDSLVQKSESIYGEAEKDRHTGYLWIDRKSENFVVTLGALNGLHKGSRLNVYENDKIIDSVTVDLPFDIVSFVRPGNSIDQFSKDYYRVAAEF